MEKYLAEISGRKISSKHPPMIIAELSGNHRHSLDEALKMVKACSDSGVCAVKLQTYTPDTITLDVQNEEFLIQDRANPWHGQSLYELYKKAYTPWEWHEEIFEACKNEGMLAFSSAFDETSVDFLESLNVPCYKISSFEATHLPLIEKVAKTKKPMILSTGMCSLGEIEMASKTYYQNGGEDLILLKCTSTYPSDPKNTNLATLPHMEKLFKCPVGLSDHTLGIGASVASVALGASVIEKHFVLKHGQGAIDEAFSLDPIEMKNLVLESKRAFDAIGDVQYGSIQSEEAFINHRRSIYISKDVAKGDTLNHENIKVVRPAHGLAPKYFYEVLGKKIKMDAKKGDPLHWSLL